MRRKQRGRRLEKEAGLGLRKPQKEAEQDSDLGSCMHQKAPSHCSRVKKLVQRFPGWHGWL